MARIISGDATLNFADGNFLVIIQLTAMVRFREGEGFFVTSAGTDDNGGTRAVTIWFHPSVPLSFEYDGGDAQIEVDDDLIKNYVEMSRSDYGIVLGEFEQWPFRFKPIDEDAQTE